MLSYTEDTPTYQAGVIHKIDLNNLIMIIPTSLNSKTTPMKTFDKIAMNHLKENILAVQNIIIIDKS